MNPAELAASPAAVPAVAPPGLPDAVLPAAALAPFLAEAAAEYARALRDVAVFGHARHFPRAWALLVGRDAGRALEVVRLEFGRNVRGAGPARTEFDRVIAPRFGRMYENAERGYWCDARMLLAVSEAAEADGLALLGSVHLHPDWHRIGPPHERSLPLTECPTPTDEHLFRNTGWPLNLICATAGRDGSVSHTLAAWAPPPRDDAGAASAELAIVCGGRRHRGPGARLRLAGPPLGR